ncbi:MAG: hypothetical protein ABIC91_06670 [Nanoarchaeota archaeon]
MNKNNHIRVLVLFLIIFSMLNISFVLANEPPLKPELNAPINGHNSWVYKMKPALLWFASTDTEGSDVTRYNLTVSCVDDDYGDIFEFNKEITSADDFIAYQFSDEEALELEHVYTCYWSVQAIDPDDSTIQSELSDSDLYEFHVREPYCEYPTYSQLDWTLQLLAGLGLNEWPASYFDGEFDSYTMVICDENHLISDQTKRYACVYEDFTDQTTNPAYWKAINDCGDSGCHNTRTAGAAWGEACYSVNDIFCGCNCVDNQGNTVLNGQTTCGEDSYFVYRCIDGSIEKELANTEFDCTYEYGSESSCIDGQCGLSNYCGEYGPVGDDYWGLLGLNFISDWSSKYIYDDKSEDPCCEYIFDCNKKTIKLANIESCSPSTIKENMVCIPRTCQYEYNDNNYKSLSNRIWFEENEQVCWNDVHTCEREEFAKLYRWETNICEFGCSYKDSDSTIEPTSKNNIAGCNCGYDIPHGSKYCEVNEFGVNTNTGQVMRCENGVETEHIYCPAISGYVCSEGECVPLCGENKDNDPGGKIGDIQCFSDTCYQCSTDHNIPTTKWIKSGQSTCCPNTYEECFAGTCIDTRTCSERGGKTKEECEDESSNPRYMQCIDEVTFEKVDLTTLPFTGESCCLKTCMDITPCMIRAKSPWCEGPVCRTCDEGETIDNEFEYVVTSDDDCCESPNLVCSSGSDVNNKGCKAIPTDGDFCIDTDGFGVDPSVKGFCDSTAANGWDSCVDENTVYEQYCDYSSNVYPNGICSKIQVACSRGTHCEYGECVSDDTDSWSCIETDRGSPEEKVFNNPEILGECKDSRGTYNDECLDSETVIEYTCSRDYDSESKERSCVELLSICPEGKVCMSGECRQIGEDVCSMNNNYYSALETDSSKKRACDNNLVMECVLDENGLGEWAFKEDCEQAGYICINGECNSPCKLFVDWTDTYGVESLDNYKYKTYQGINIGTSVYYHFGCIGKTINFVVFEYDNLIGKPSFEDVMFALDNGESSGNNFELAKTQPAAYTITNYDRSTFITSNWVAEYIDDIVGEPDYTFYAYVADNRDIYSEAAKQLNVKEDITPPQISSYEPTETSDTKTSIVIWIEDNNGMSENVDVTVTKNGFTDVQGSIITDYPNYPNKDKLVVSFHPDEYFNIGDDVKVSVSAYDFAGLPINGLYEWNFKITEGSNEPPTITSLRIWPENPLKERDITCIANITDIDSELEDISMLYSITITDKFGVEKEKTEGEVFSPTHCIEKYGDSENKQYQCFANIFFPPTESGDKVTCKAKVFDNYNYGWDDTRYSEPTTVTAIISVLEGDCQTLFDEAKETCYVEPYSKESCTTGVIGTTIDTFVNSCPNAIDYIAYLKYLKAKCLYNSENYEDALPLFQEVITDYPTSFIISSAYFLKGLINLKLDDGKFIFTMQELIETQSNNNDKVIGMALAKLATHFYVLVGDSDTAKDYFEQYLKEWQGRGYAIDAHITYVKLLINKQLYREALVECKKILHNYNIGGSSYQLDTVKQLTTQILGEYLKTTGLIDTNAREYSFLKAFTDTYVGYIQMDLVLNYDPTYAEGDTDKYYNKHLKINLIDPITGQIINPQPCMFINDIKRIAGSNDLFRVNIGYNIQTPKENSLIELGKEYLFKVIMRANPDTPWDEGVVIYSQTITFYDMDSDDFVWLKYPNSGSLQDENGDVGYVFKIIGMDYPHHQLFRSHVSSVIDRLLQVYPFNKPEYQQLLHFYYLSYASGDASIMATPVVQMFPSNFDFVFSYESPFRSFVSTEFDWSKVIQPIKQRDMYLSTNTNQEDLERTFIHEFGHAFGGLVDEYVETDIGDHTQKPNCAPAEDVDEYWGINSLFGNLIGEGPAETISGEFPRLVVGQYQGCSYINSNIRPTSIGIMRNQEFLTPEEFNHGFGRVNEECMELMLKNKYMYSCYSQDNNQPDITELYPADGSTVGQNIHISAKITDAEDDSDTGIYKYKFYIQDSSNQGFESVSAADLTFVNNILIYTPKHLDPGLYKASIIAYDHLLNRKVNDWSFTVDPAADSYECTGSNDGSSCVDVSCIEKDYEKLKAWLENGKKGVCQEGMCKPDLTPPTPPTGSVIAITEMVTGDEAEEGSSCAINPYRFEANYDQYKLIADMNLDHYAQKQYSSYNVFNNELMESFTAQISTKIIDGVLTQNEFLGAFQSAFKDKYDINWVYSYMPAFMEDSMNKFTDMTSFFTTSFQKKDFIGEPGMEGAAAIAATQIAEKDSGSFKLNIKPDVNKLLLQDKAEIAIALSIEKQFTDSNLKIDLRVSKDLSTGEQPTLTARFTLRFGTGSTSGGTGNAIKDITGFVTRGLEKITGKVTGDDSITEIVCEGTIDDVNGNFVPDSCNLKVLNNKKDMTKFTDKTVIITTDEDWHKPLKATPLSSWTNINDISCQDGNRPGKCLYPLLIYHEEEVSGDYAFDTDSVTEFVTKWGADKAYFYDDTTQQPGTQVIVGANLEEGSYEQITNSKYLEFWEEITTVVISEDDYDTGLLASILAAQKNAPLLFKDYDEISPEILSKKIIVVGDITLAGNVVQSFTKEELREQLYSNSDKILVINTNDIENFAVTNQINDQGIALQKVFWKDSLSAPVLSFAKEEKIAFVNGGYNQIYAYNDLKYITILANHNFLPQGTEPPSVDECLALKSNGYSDKSCYAARMNNPNPVKYVGRIFGITPSDTSSYVARSIFFSDENNKMIKPVEKVILRAGDDVDSNDYMYNLAKLYNPYYETICSVFDSRDSICTKNTVADEDVLDSDIIYYDGHSVYYYWMNWYTNYFRPDNNKKPVIPYMNNVFGVGASCNTNAFFRMGVNYIVDHQSEYDGTYLSSYLFGAEFLKHGAIGYLGAMTGSNTIDGQIMSSSAGDDMMQQLLRTNGEIGRLVYETYENDPFCLADNTESVCDTVRLLWPVFILYGDPTIQLNLAEESTQPDNYIITSFEEDDDEYRLFITKNEGTISAPNSVKANTINSESNLNYDCEIKKYGSSTINDENVLFCTIDKSEEAENSFVVMNFPDENFVLKKPNIDLFIKSSDLKFSALDNTIFMLGVPESSQTLYQIPIESTTLFIEYPDVIDYSLDSNSKKLYFLRDGIIKEKNLETDVESTVYESNNILNIEADNSNTGVIYLLKAEDDKLLVQKVLNENILFSTEIIINEEWWSIIADNYDLSQDNNYLYITITNKIFSINKQTGEIINTNVVSEAMNKIEINDLNAFYVRKNRLLKARNLENELTTTITSFFSVEDGVVNFNLDGQNNKAYIKTMNTTKPVTENIWLTENNQATKITTPNIEYIYEIWIDEQNNKAYMKTRSPSYTENIYIIENNQATNIITTPNTQSIYKILIDEQNNKAYMKTKNKYTSLLESLYIIENNQATKITIPNTKDIHEIWIDKQNNKAYMKTINTDNTQNIYVYIIENNQATKITTPNTQSIYEIWIDEQNNKAYMKTINTDNTESIWLIENNQATRLSQNLIDLAINNEEIYLLTTQEIIRISDDKSIFLPTKADYIDIFDGQLYVLSGSTLIICDQDLNEIETFNLPISLSS